MEEVKILTLDSVLHLQPETIMGDHQRQHKCWICDEGYPRRTGARSRSRVLEKLNTMVSLSRVDILVHGPNGPNWPI